jgi:hypothetical protein
VTRFIAANIYGDRPFLSLSARMRSASHHNYVDQPENLYLESYRGGLEIHGDDLSGVFIFVYRKRVIVGGLPRRGEVARDRGRGGGSPERGRGRLKGSRLTRSGWVDQEGVGCLRWGRSTGMGLSPGRGWVDQKVVHRVAV